MKRQMIALSFFALLVPAMPVFAEGSATAKVSISLDVSVTAKVKAEAADKLYAAGDYKGAIKLYQEGYDTYKDAAFLYAKAQCEKALGQAADAKKDFDAYLALGTKVTLKYKAEAETGVKEVSSAVIGVVGGVATGVVGATKATLTFASSLSISANVSVEAQASAKSGDDAYAAGKYQEAKKYYAEAAAKKPEPTFLYAEAQCELAAGHKSEAIGLLQGYLSAKGTLKYKKEAQASLKELKAKSKEKIKVSVAASVSATVKTEAKAADALAAAGDYAGAAKAYGELYAKSSSDAALLYAQGQCYRLAGDAAKAKETLNAYLAVSGKLKFKAEADAAVTDTSY
jgi:tetratricopeptide (TPR) repeat protein